MSALVDPTTAEKIAHYLDMISSLERRLYASERNRTNLLLENTELKKAIEHARQQKPRIGAELALRELVIDVKEGNISTKYRDKKTIKMLQEKFND